MSRNTQVSQYKIITIISKSLKYGLFAVLVGINSVAALTVTPVQSAVGATAPSGASWEYVTSGGGFSCALFNSEAYCWGQNEYGQLGDGTTITRPKPHKVQGALTGKIISKIDAGYTHACAIANNQVYCWGNNGSGTLGDGTNTDSSVPVAVSTSGVLAGKSIEKIVVNDDTSCVIDANNKAYCWGDNRKGQFSNGVTGNSNIPLPAASVGPVASKTIQTVGIGWDDVCFLTTDQMVYCAGENGSGQLGDGTTTNSSVAVALSITGALAGKTIDDIGMGGYFSCVLTTDDNVYCWGADYVGQLGDGTTNDSSVPVAVSASGTINGKAITAIYSGQEEACVTANDGTYCWGANYTGELGDGTTTDRYSPAKVSTNTGFPSSTSAAQVSIGEYYGQYPDAGVHTCAIASGRLYCWGNNTGGVLGFGNPGIASSTTPIPFSNESVQALQGRTFTSVSPSAAFTCGVTNDSKAYCWGFNGDGELGIGSTTSSSVPVAVSTSGVLAGKTILKVASGARHACAIADDGKAYCWGVNWTGQLGDGSTTDSDVPVAVSTSGVLAGKTLVGITAGKYTTCAIASDGKAYCWGYNGAGQLGDGTTTDSNVPVAVSTSGVLAGKTIVEIDISDFYIYSSSLAGHVCAVTSDGGAYCWGTGGNYNSSGGQLGDGNGADSSLPVAVSTSGVLAGKTLTHIALGEFFSCAISSEGKAYCWGAAGQGWGGSLGDGTANSSNVPVAVSTSGVLAGKSLISITADGYRACALSTEGKMYCWGSDYANQLGDGISYISNIPIAVSNSGVMAGKTVQSLGTTGASCSIYSDNQVYCWGGYNNVGQLANPPYSVVQKTTPFLYDYTLPEINTLTEQMSTPISKRPTFTGVAEPGSTVVVTVHSNPVTCTTTADYNGNWSCTLPSDLPAGQHTVNVVVTTLANDVINLGPYTVTVAASGTLSGNINSPDTGGGVVVSLGSVALVALLICSIIFILIPRRKGMS